MAMTIATMGRRMKKSAMGYSFSDLLVDACAAAA